MNKILVIGDDAAGKTCYCLGMMEQMVLQCRRYKEFYIQPLVDGNLYRTLERLADISLSFADRFPEASAINTTYSFDVIYSGNKVHAIEVIDCAEGCLYGVHDRIQDNVTCILFCIDGKSIYGNIGDIPKIIDEIWNPALMQFFSHYTDDYAQLPPVCIIVTKYDSVSPALKNIESITDIVKNVFPYLFQEHAGIVSICPVTLVVDIEKHGRFEPKNVAMPMLFAEYYYLKRFIDNENFPSLFRSELFKELDGLPVYVNGEMVQYRL